jgi:hypothetical protein
MFTINGIVYANVNTPNLTLRTFVKGSSLLMVLSTESYRNSIWVYLL